MGFVNWLQQEINTNQFLVGALGGGIIYTVLAYVRTVFYWAVSLFNFFFKREIVCRENEDFYVGFMRFVGNRINNPRVIRLSKSDGKLVSIIGKGNHRFFFMNSFFSISVHEEIKAGTDKPVEHTTINIWSLFVDKKVEEVKDRFYKSVPELSEVATYKYNGLFMSFEQLENVKKRTFESVFVNNDIKAKLINVLEEFKNNKTYEKIGINRKVGIILYGPPGTGKSSIARAISNYMALDSYYIPPDPKSAKNAINDIKFGKGKKVIVIDDIDCLSQTIVDRKAKDEIGLSHMLEFLDGDLDDCIIVATTNNYDTLDSAIKRSGRFDVKAYIGPADKETAKAMIEYINPSKMHLLDTFEYPIIQADIQARLLNRGEIEL